MATPPLPPAARPAGPVLISLSSYGSAETRRHGQAWFTRLAAEAGADGVEVRGELLTGGRGELQQIAEAARGLLRVYSSPEGLWGPDGRLDEDALSRALEAASVLDAPRLKMSIGGFGAASQASLAVLSRRLADPAAAELVIENDQTVPAGSVPALQRFFDACAAQDLDLGMTFDLGNWHWVGECPQAAAQALGPRVRYVHCKGVFREARRWVAVPLAESAAPWRAVLRQLPASRPLAIEYPLVGDDLLSVTREQLAVLRSAMGQPS